MTTGLRVVGSTPFFPLLALGLFAAFILGAFRCFGFLALIDLGVLTLGAFSPLELIFFSFPTLIILLPTIAVVLFLPPYSLFILIAPPTQEEFFGSLLPQPFQIHELKFVVALLYSEGFSILRTSPDFSNSGLCQESASSSGSQYRDDPNGSV